MSQIWICCDDRYFLFFFICINEERRRVPSWLHVYEAAPAKKRENIIFFFTRILRNATVRPGAHDTPLVGAQVRSGVTVLSEETNEKNGGRRLIPYDMVR
jgi:hypothetical protein